MLDILVRLRLFMIASSIILLLVSALISFFFIHQNEALIMDLQSQIERNDGIVNGLWQSTISHDIDLSTLKILNHLKNDTTNTETDIILARKETAIEKINDLYLKQLNLQQILGQRDQKNRVYFSLALFMQILSIALVTITQALEGRETKA